MAYVRKPEWLKIKLGSNEQFKNTSGILGLYGLNTICSSGRCPNMGECWNRGTATFMIGGDICTRSCKFCNTKTGKPFPLNLEEPQNIAKSIRLMNLKHAVITSVDRDDLPDLGAAHWVDTIMKIKELTPDTTIEVLIPDFQGRGDLVDMVCNASPNIISHNMETVKRLTPQVRSAAKYEISLSVLHRIAQNGLKAKSGIMLGLGESTEEILEVMDDLRSVNCSIITMGQYLQPSRKHLPVSDYVHPDEFSRLKEIALSKGFEHVESGPLVRSSYHAEKCI